MLPTERLSLEVGASHLRWEQKIIVHYLIATGMVVVRFIIGFRRTGDIKAPAANLSPEVGVSHPTYKQQMLFLYRMAMDMGAARYEVG